MSAPANGRFNSQLRTAGRSSGRLRAAVPRLCRWARHVYHDAPRCLSGEISGFLLLLRRRKWNLEVGQRSGVCKCWATV